VPVYNRVTCGDCLHTFDCDDNNDFCPECGCNWRRTR
jgi:rRNA maturation endonuclease Nob1